MNFDALYGPMYRARVAARDGHVYRADVCVHAYDGPVTELPMKGLVVSWGADGGAVTGGAPLAPVAASRAVLTVGNDRPGRMAFIGQSADGTVALRLVRETGDEADDVADGGPGLCWFGYALPESVEDAPYDAESVTRVTFADGLGTLDSRPVAGVGAETGGVYDYTATGEKPWSARTCAALLSHVLSSLGGDPAAAAAGTGGWAGLTTAVDWRPWLPDTEIGDDEDPLARLMVREGVWMDADGASVSMLAALRVIAERFNARLFQSGGRWHLVQRGLLARTGGVAVPRFLYDAGPATTGLTGTLESAALARETRTLAQGGGPSGPRRTFALPVRTVESLTAVRDDFDSLLVNGSFEQWPGVPFALTTASDWVQVQAERVDADDWYDALTAGDRYVMEMASTTLARGTATQDNRAFVPSSPEWTFRATWQQYIEGLIALAGIDTAAQAPYGGLALGIGAHVAARAGFRTAGEIYPGSRAHVGVEPFGEGVTGAAVGTLAVPEGATLEMFEGSTDQLAPVARITLTRSAYVGDLYLEGDVEIADGETAPLTASLYGYFHHWEDGGGGAVTGVMLNGSGSQKIERSTREVVLPGTDLAGVAVAGYVSVTLVNVAVSVAGTYTGAVDDVVLALSTRGSDISASGVRVRLPAGVPGLDVALTSSPQPIGDGPTSVSLGVIDVLTGDEEAPGYLRTNQGEDTGWTEGAYAPAAASSEVTLDELAGRDALAQLANAERARTDFLMRGGAFLSPEHVVTHWPLVALAEPAVVGAETVYTYVPPAVGAEIIVGAQTANGRPRAEAETHTVESVVAGAGVFAVTLAAPLTASHPAGSRCAYSRHFWWDSFTWDVPEGAIGADLTGLDLDARDPSTELILAT